MSHMAVEIDEVEPDHVPLPECEFCTHGWHGFECRSVVGQRRDSFWPSLRGHACGCPSSFVEPPC